MQWEQRNITPKGNGTEKTKKGCNYFTFLCTFLEKREKNKLCTISDECRQPKNSKLSENNLHITHARTTISASVSAVTGISSDSPCKSLLFPSLLESAIRTSVIPHRVFTLQVQWDHGSVCGCVFNHSVIMNQSYYLCKLYIILLKNHFTCRTLPSFGSCAGLQVLISAS